MRAEFTRTITESIIKASVITLEAGQVKTTPCEPFTELGKVDEDKALTLTKAKYGKKQQYLVEVSSSDTTYSISVEDFLKYAKKVEPKTEVTEVGK